MSNEKENATSGFQILFNWIARLAYLNVLWFLFTLFGLVIFGVGPATVSIYTIMRKWLYKGDDFSIWKTFKNTFAAEFVSANKLMLVIVPVCLFIYMDFAIVRTLPNSVLIDMVVFPAIILLTVIVLIGINYTFASYVHFNVTFWMYFKYALLIAGIFPLQTMLSVIGIFAFGVAFFVYPALVPFYGISVPVLVIQLCFIKSVDKISVENSIKNASKKKINRE